jgi:glycosyltransferase involved in cell wall biosynthesis
MVSVLVPTRGRPEGVERLLASAYDLSEGPLDFVFYMDDDDPQRDATTEVIRKYGASLTVGERITLSKMWNKCYDLAIHDLLMQCGDDIVFRTQGWDVKFAEAFEQFPDRIAFVHGDDGFQHDRIGTHGVLHRRWVEAVGYFVPPYFASDYNDLWLTEVADALGRRVYLPDVLTEHMHPVAGKGELDLTHQERIQRHREEDCDRIWRDTAGKRATDVAQLRAVILGHRGIETAP